MTVGSPAFSIAVSVPRCKLDAVDVLPVGATRAPDVPPTSEPLPHPEGTLVWVLVEGQLAHVSSFAQLAPRQRPSSACPVCRRSVILKLGSRVAHHAAHRPGDACVVTAGESALHLNTKCHLAAVLREAVAAGTATLTVEERCIVGEHLGFPDARCGNTQARVWAADWDEVAIEYRFGQRVPDVMLLKAGAPVGAIEVFATHRVDDEKAAALRELGVPWLEVKADEALFAAETAWTCALPLRAEQEGPRRSWRCPPHEAERLAEIERRRHSTVTVAARIVDVYYPSGKRFRALWTVEERLTDGAPVSARVLMNDQVQLELPVATSDPTSPERRAVRKKFQRTFDAWSERCAKSARFVDSPMKWTSAEHARQVAELAFDFRYFPRRYVWAPSRSDWWSPPELEHATWERQQGAWMDIHPAVIERYQARKEYGRRMHAERRARQQAAGQQQQEQAGRGTADPDGAVRDAPVPPAAAALWEEVVKLRPALGLRAVGQDVLYGARIIRLLTADNRERMLLLPESTVSPEGVRRVHQVLQNSGLDVLWLVLPPSPGTEARLPSTPDGPALAWATVGDRGDSEVLHANGRLEPSAALLERWLTSAHVAAPGGPY